MLSGLLASSDSASDLMVFNSSLGDEGLTTSRNDLLVAGHSKLLYIVYLSYMIYGDNIPKNGSQRYHPSIHPSDHHPSAEVISASAGATAFSKLPSPRPTKGPGSSWPTALALWQAQEINSNVRVNRKKRWHIDH
jgi:hypothetical protein